MPNRRRRILVTLATVVAFLLVLGVGHKVVKSRSFQLFGTLTQRVTTGEKVVALTFDDGPTSADTDAILTSLEAAGVRATFYLTGKGCAENPDATRRIIAQGHEVGNHTWHHRRMIGVLPHDVAAEIEPTDACLRDAGWDDEITVRPPYGSKLVVFPAWLAVHHRHTVMWDVAAEDYSAKVEQTTEEIVEETVSATRPGSIILLHPWDGRTRTQQAIPQIIERLRSNGYRFVTVTDLLQLG
ncbi:MAG: polysaccharide deacetylase family protein [Arachnia propionica]|uniref:polysaccharide deacetylase family protein n=1 Tax=Arachnia propionica TaxID=1750 RepID=UPI002702A378|nr:polysaccharide deacetylase family protein [Arachnia propionica]